MALTESLPYGLRDVKIATVSAVGIKGTLVDLPNARTLTFEEAEDFDTLRGDDNDVATRGKGAQVTWNLESGGISLEAYAVMNGGTVATSGVTPNQVKTYSKATGISRPEFFAEGQAMSESGGDFHTVLYRCKATGSLKGELGDGAFWLTQADGACLPSRLPANNGKIYDFVQNETVATIV